MQKFASKIAAAAVAASLAVPALAAENQLDLRVSLILEGIYFNELRHGNASPAGFGGGHHHHHGHGHGHSHSHGHDHSHGLEEGFSLGHSELSFEASLGELLDGFLMLGFDRHHIEVEEAYLTTRSLPAGFQLKGGQFLSGIGYINSRHSHDWDFVDRPLVNEYLFGDHGLQETGLQATWLAPSDTYTLVGVELLQGAGDRFDRFDEGRVDQKSGPRLTTAFLKVGPDWGADHAAQFGLSAGYARQYVVFDDHGNHAHSKEGDSWFAGADAVYKYSAGRSHGHGDVRIAAEYYYVSRSLTHYRQGHDDSWSQRNSDTEKQDGFYVEAVYGVAPRWELGARAEALGITNEMLTGHFSSIHSLDTSYRYSGQITFRPAEPIFLRAQINHNDFADRHGHSDEGWGLMLQVNVALGAHGAHTF